MYSSYQENKSLNLESKLQQSVNRFWENNYFRQNQQR
jgi:hypothetical protein